MNEQGLFVIKLTFLVRFAKPSAYFIRVVTNGDVFFVRSSHVEVKTGLERKCTVEI